MLRLRSLGGAVLLSAICSFGTGCAAFNPKASWALQEQTPMAVVLRRADSARSTAESVDRLLGATPVDVSSKWIGKLGLKKADAEAALKEIGTDGDYGPVPKGKKLRVMQAEVWAQALGKVCPHETKFPNLLADVSPELGTAYVDVATQGKKVAKLKADKAAEEAALDDKDASADARDQHEKKKREIDEQIDELEAEYKPRVDAFLAKVRELVPQASAEAKKQLPVAAVVLSRAVADAKLSNAVAMLRYPLAMPGMAQELKTQAKRIIADVVEEKTGHRLTLEGFSPDIKIEGGAPKLTLNGLPPEALRALPPDALLKDVTVRSKDYVVKVLTLLPYAAETEQMLDLQADVAKAMMEGMNVEEAKVEGAGEDLGDLVVEVSDAAPPPKAGRVPRHPVARPSCAPKPAVKSAVEDDAARRGSRAAAKGDAPSKQPAS